MATAGPLQHVFVLPRLVQGFYHKYSCFALQCCSNEGYCGVTPSHCDVGKCVELWGSCPGKPPPTDPPQDSGDRALDTKTIVGMVSAIVVGLGKVQLECGLQHIKLPKSGCIRRRLCSCWRSIWQL